MKRIKKFFELFDTQELRDRADATDIKGNDVINNLGNFRENISKFITKISRMNFPFIEAFTKGGKKIDDFVTYARYDDTMERWNLVAESKKYKLILGVAINSVSNYDVFIDLKDKEEKETKSISRFHITYMDLVNLIEKNYSSIAKQHGFGKLIEYNRSNYISKYN